MGDFNNKKMGTAFVVTQIIMEIVHTDREEVHRKIELTRDLASWVHSMIADTDEVGVIDKAINDIEEIREDYEPIIDISPYDKRTRDFEKDIADVLQSIYAVINKYDLIDPNGITEGKASTHGIMRKKEDAGRMPS